MAQRRACGGRLVAIDDVYECNEVARDAQLEAFFQRIDEWFDALSKQLAAFAVETDLKTAIQIHVMWRRSILMLRRTTISKRRMNTLKEFV